MYRKKLFQCLIYLSFSLLSASCFAVQGLEEINEYINQASSWQENRSSGSCSICYNKVEKAIRFAAHFDKRKKQHWFYPAIKFSGEKWMGLAERLEFEIKVVPTKPYKFSDARVMFTFSGEKGSWPRWEVPAPGKWKKIVIDLKSFAGKLEALNGMKIGLNPKADKIIFFLKNIRFICPKYKPSIDTSQAIRSNAPGYMFLKGEKLAFQLDIPRDVIYTIKDFRGKVYKSEPIPKGELLLPELPCGYYFIELKSEKLKFHNRRSFCIVPPRAKMPKGKVSNFAIDSGISAARANPANSAFPRSGKELLVDICVRAGIFTTRDRNWRSERKPGQYIFAKYLNTAEMLKKRGIAMAGMVENTPPWNRSGKIPSAGNARTVGLAPDDLRTIYEYCQSFSQALKTNMEYCEYLNEPDHLHHDSMWEHSANIKAAFLGFRAGNKDLKVLSGSFCTGNMQVVDLFMKNGGCYYFDMLNYHTYTGLSQYPELLAKIRKVLSGYNIADRAIVFTENGTNYEGDALIKGYIPNTRIHSFEQEMVQAEFILKSQLLMQKLGVTIDFSFYLSPYSERGGKKDWGLLRQDYSAKPGLAAFAVLSHYLSPLDYLGSFSPTANCTGMLYHDTTGRQTAVLWRNDIMDSASGGMRIKYDAQKFTEVTIPVADGTYIHSDFFGKTEKIKAVNGKLSLKLSRFPSYLTGLRSFKVESPSYRQAVIGAQNDPDIDKTIILRLITGASCQIDSSLKFARMNESSDSFELEVYNFSDKRKVGSLSLEGGIFSEIPKTIELGSYERKSFRIKYQAPARKDLWGKVVVNGEFNQKAVTPAWVPLLFAFRADKMKSVPLNVLQPQRWRNNSSGKMKIKAGQNNNEVVFNVVFDKSEHWIYPEMVLKGDESLAGAAGISFDIAIDSLGRNKLKMAGLYLVTDTVREHGKAKYYKFLPPKDDQWKKVQIFFSDDDFIKKVKMLRVGINPYSKKASYKLRNLNLIFDAEK